MSDDGADRLLRTAISGRPSGLGGKEPLPMFAPGRPALEAAVLLAALAILVPALGIGAVGFAWRAHRRGNRRWLAALLAAVWCVGLGIVLRRAGGLPLVP